jgi:hypothetical protein
MDRTILSTHHFSLKAIVVAILALHAETALAASCPSFIDSNLAGVICEFDAITGTNITIASGGVVGGINMMGYNPSAPSFIAIDAGGTISGVTGAAIAISSSSLTNGLSNNGTISSASGTAIVITNNSTISGDISNNGLISGSNSALVINNSVINGNLVNNGTMISANGTGIILANSSTLNGNISNSGTITSGHLNAGIAILNHNIIIGDITNSGLIESSGSGNGIIIRSTSTLNGGISNSGTIKSMSSTSIAILNVSTIQGDITNNGTISGGTSGLSIHNNSTLDGNILNNSLISGATANGISIYSGTTVSGSISNSGTISGGQNGILVASSSVINGSISNSGTIQGDMFAIKIDSNSNVSEINILGQNARIIGNVDAPNTNLNITSDAKFTSEGTYNVNFFNIGSNALFNMQGTITALGVNNSGILATNSAQTINGNYTQQINGIFQTSITNTSQYGSLSVTDNVDLSQSGNLNVQVAQNASLHSGDIFSNVISGNTLISSVNGLQVNDNSYFWVFTPTLNNSNNGINLTTSINPDVYNTCQGAFCRGAATTIIGQIAAGNPLFSPYAALPTAEELQEAASQATPELTNENTQTIQLTTRAIFDVIPMWNTLHGKSAGDAMFYPAGKIWIKPYGAAMTQNERNTVDGFNATAYGVVIGKDLRFTEDGLLGGAFAIGSDNMDGKSVLNGQSINSDIYQGILYGAKKFPNHLYVAGQGLVGYEDNNTNRSIPLYVSTAKGSYNSWFTNLRAEAGWSTFAFNSNLIFTPAVDASYLFINQGSYHESGSPMNLFVASSNNSSLILGAYGNLAYHLKTNHEYDLTLTGYAGIADNVINSQPRTTATFVAGGPSFSTFGVNANAAVFRGGAGLVIAKEAKPLALEFNYDLQTGNNAYSYVGSATLKYSV